MILEALRSLFQFVMDIFGKLSPETQAEIIKAIVEAFDWIFRSLYRAKDKKAGV